jgi:hypothetical protein
MISCDQRHNPASAVRFWPYKRPENFSVLLHYLTAAVFFRKLVVLRAPVAQLDRASDYGLKTTDFHPFSWHCFSRATEGKMQFWLFAGLLTFVKFSALTINKR